MNAPTNKPSGAKIRAIIKRPDEKCGHVTNISQTLRNLQRIVEGYIEVVPITKTAVCIVNEEGKIRGLPRNFILGIPPFHDVIVGTAIIVGTDGEDFTDCPLDFKTWKEALKKWGNV
jgi:hypothetical protein